VGAFKLPSRVGEESRARGGLETSQETTNQIESELRVASEKQGDE